MPDRSTLDPDKMRDYAKHMFGMMNGATVATMVALGDRLGLYKALCGAGAVTSSELAERTSLDERWVREWLYTQGAGGVLEYEGDGRFALTPEGEALLVDESHPANGIGFFSQLPDLMGVIERLPEAFKSGRGLNYDSLGPGGARGVERGLAPWFRSLLVPMALPKIDAVSDELGAGTVVADVGCGAGVALIEMAKHFPNSDFHGYDVSKHALERGEENKRDAGIANVTFHDAASDPLPQDGRFGFVTTFDCLHDMSHPADVIQSIRGAIADEGTWLIADIKALPSYEENVEENPMAGMMYSFSVLVCMSSALSEPDGAGLGTLGLHEGLLQEMTEQAGFTRFTPVDMGHPMNAFYVVRP
jgi:hypothetical protein